MNREQEEVLSKIVDYAENTEFGKIHHFAEIKTIEDFRARVPISEYTDYLPAIERLKMAEENLLFPGKAASFAVSSATTGDAKYLPDSEEGLKAKQRVVTERRRRMRLSIPKLADESKRVFVITNATVYGYTEGGIPTGSASGQTAQKSKNSENRYSVPECVTSTYGISNHTMEYLNLLFNIAQDNVIGLVCNNVAHFGKLMTYLNENAEMFLKDLQKGTISIDIEASIRDEVQQCFHANPKRAEKLRAVFQQKGKLTVADLWKEFCFVGCWTTSSVGRTSREYRSLFPENTLYYDWGFGASEGKFNIPYTAECADGIVAEDAYFFEFLPLEGGKPLLLQETRENGLYELIITSYSGLYRYNMHDLVKIGADFEGKRTMQFVCKMSDYGMANHQRLIAGELQLMVEEYEKLSGGTLQIRLFQAKAEEDGLQLLIEPVSQENFDAAVFEEFMTKRLSEHSIVLKKLQIMKQGYRDSIFEKNIQSGKTVNQAKILTFLK